MSSGQDEQRQYRRHSRRVPCAFRVANEDQRGFVTNVSARGFFVQTRSRLEPGTDLLVTIESDSTSPIVVKGAVARVRKSHRSMSSIDQSGMGIEIESAPEEYYALVLELEEKE